MKPILVATDLSERSQKAVNRALQLAAELKTRLAIFFGSVARHLSLVNPPFWFSDMRHASFPSILERYCTVVRYALSECFGYQAAMIGAMTRVTTYMWGLQRSQVAQSDG